MGIPTMIGMLINALYNLVDAYFVGRLGESQMGAISVAFPLGQLIVGLGLLFGNGSGSYISRLQINLQQSRKHRVIQRLGGRSDVYTVFGNILKTYTVTS